MIANFVSEILQPGFFVTRRTEEEEEEDRGIAYSSSWMHSGVATTIQIQQFFCITFHFYFLLRLFSSNLKIITSHNSTINLCTTSMAAERFVKPRKYIAGISELAALARQLNF